MWIDNKLFDYLLFAIRWFWTHYNKYKEEDSMIKVILLFICSLSGLLLMVGTFAWLIAYLITYHVEILIGLGLIIWLYAYVKAKIDKETEEKTIQKAENIARIVEEESELEIQAKKSRRLVCNVLYQTLREMAEDIGDIAPRLSSEIEIFDIPFYIRSNLIFYQFRLIKEAQTLLRKRIWRSIKKVTGGYISKNSMW